jgi:tetratricopeptide (TPR) repeat protein
MSTQNQNPAILAGVTRLAGEEYRTQLKTEGTRVARLGYQSLLATQMGAAIEAEPTERYKIGDQIGGRYEVLAIHRGSMGVVYGTFDQQEQLPRALKTLQERFVKNREMRDLFSEEAAIWVLLGKHPFIVRAYSVENHDFRPHVISDYVLGEQGMSSDLRAWIGHSRLTLKLAVEFALQIAQGMEHAARTIPALVHRDLKPANVLVDSRARAMITDFGLVCAAESEAGTPAYMAPEQWRGESLDTRTDVYSFGCILYEMFTGHRMFAAETIEDWRHAHLFQTPVDPSMLRPDLPERISALVIKCLAKAIAERPQSWEQIVGELAKMFNSLTGQPAVFDFSTYELTASELVNAGHALARLKKYRDALSVCDRALEIDPHCPAALIQKAKALHEMECYDEAISCWEQAQLIDPRIDHSWIKYGDKFYKMECFEHAIACLDRAIAISPKSLDARFEKARALGKLSRYDEEIECYDHALSVAPNNLRALFGKGAALRQLERYDEAIRCYELILDSDPKNARACYAVGAILLTLKRFEEAIVCFDRALEIDPQFSEAISGWSDKGHALIALGRYEAAITCFDAALDLADVPLSPPAVFEIRPLRARRADCYYDAWFTKGIAFLNLQFFDVAKECFDKALTMIDPDRPEARSQRVAIQAMRDQLASSSKSKAKSK